MERTRKFFHSKQFYIILSVFLAVVAWLTVALSLNPEASKIIRNIPVTYSLNDSTAQELGLNVIESKSTKYVNITVTGKRYKIGPLGPDDFKATASLNKVTEVGTYKLDVVVTPVVADSDYSIASVSPRQVTAQFEKYATKTLKLEVSAENIRAADGYILQSCYTSPESVIVRGPASDIDQIERASAVTDKEAVLDDTLTFTGNVVLYNKEGKKLDLKTVSIDNESPDITVLVYKMKTVPLKFDYLNMPEGFDKSSLSYTMTHNEAEITSIRVAGPKDAVDNLKEVSLGTVDFKRLSKTSNVFDMDLSLPVGFASVDGISKVRIAFDSSGWERKVVSITKDQFSFKNVPAEYEVTPVRTSLSGISIVGPAGVVDTLDTGKVMAVVDFSKLSISTGTVSVPVEITIADTNTVWASDDYTLEVRIVKKSGGTGQ